MSIQKLFAGNSSINIGINPNTALYHRDNFVKHTFNFENSNPNRPNGIVEVNALGDPPKGTKLYCLG